MSVKFNTFIASYIMIIMILLLLAISSIFEHKYSQNITNNYVNNDPIKELIICLESNKHLELEEITCIP